jgi:hypothetical protein
MGAVVALNPPLAAYKMLWVAGFIVIGLAGLLSVILSEHLRHVAEPAQLRGEHERDKSIEYIKGQMASLVEFFPRTATFSVPPMPVAPKEPETIEQTLKRKAKILSTELFQFLAEWQAKEPPSPKRETWNEDTDKMLRHYSEMMLQYSTKFSGRVVALHDQLVELGVRHQDVDRTYQHPTNPLGVGALAQGFGAIAERQ